MTEFYDLTPQEIALAEQLFDKTIDDSIEELYELIHDHKQITACSAIDDLLHV